MRPNKTPPPPSRPTSRGPMFPSFLQCRGYFLLTHTMKEALFGRTPHVCVCMCRLNAACAFVCACGSVWLGLPPRSGMGFKFKCVRDVVASKHHTPDITRTLGEATGQLPGAQGCTGKVIITPQSFLIKRHVVLSYIYQL